MNNITIGIVGRKEYISNMPFMVIPNNILKYLQNKCNYMGLINYDGNYIDEDILRKCDGIIIPGGFEILPYHNQIVAYCLNNNIPILGICMGEQILGLSSLKKTDDALISVKGHTDTYHNVSITKGTHLEKLIGEHIQVNSRHKFALPEIYPPYKAVAISEDDIIEGIEYIDETHYALGVQWHPEDMDNMENIFNDFVKNCLLRKQK